MEEDPPPDTGKNVVMTEVNEMQSGSMGMPVDSGAINPSQADPPGVANAGELTDGVQQPSDKPPGEPSSPSLQHSSGTSSGTMNPSQAHPPGIANAGELADGGVQQPPVKPPGEPSSTSLQQHPSGTSSGTVNLSPADPPGVANAGELADGGVQQPPVKPPGVPSSTGLQHSSATSSGSVNLSLAGPPGVANVGELTGDGVQQPSGEGETDVAGVQEVKPKKKRKQKPNNDETEVRPKRHSVRMQGKFLAPTMDSLDIVDTDPIVMGNESTHSNQKVMQVTKGMHVFFCRWGSWFKGVVTDVKVIEGKEKFFSNFPESDEGNKSKTGYSRDKVSCGDFTRPDEITEISKSDPGLWNLVYNVSRLSKGDEVILLDDTTRIVRTNDKYCRKIQLYDSGGGVSRVGYLKVKAITYKAHYDKHLKEFRRIKCRIDRFSIQPPESSRKFNRSISVERSRTSSPFRSGVKQRQHRSTERRQSYLDDQGSPGMEPLPKVTPEVKRQQGRPVKRCLSSESRDMSVSYRPSALIKAIDNACGKYYTRTMQVLNTKFRDVFDKLEAISDGSNVVSHDSASAELSSVGSASVPTESTPLIVIGTPSPTKEPPSKSSKKVASDVSCRQLFMDTSESPPDAQQHTPLRAFANAYVGGTSAYIGTPPPQAMCTEASMQRSGSEAMTPDHVAMKRLQTLPKLAPLQEDQQARVKFENVIDTNDDSHVVVMASESDPKPLQGAGVIQPPDENGVRLVTSNDKAVGYLDASGEYIAYGDEIPIDNQPPVGETDKASNPDVDREDNLNLVLEDDECDAYRNLSLGMDDTLISHIDGSIAGRLSNSGSFYDLKGSVIGQVDKFGSVVNSQSMVVGRIKDEVYTIHVSADGASLRETYAAQHQQWSPTEQGTVTSSPYRSLKETHNANVKPLSPLARSRSPSPSANSPVFPSVKDDTFRKPFDPPQTPKRRMVVVHKRSQSSDASQRGSSGSKTLLASKSLFASPRKIDVLPIRGAEADTPPKSAFDFTPEPRRKDIDIVACLGPGAHTGQKLDSNLVQQAIDRGEARVLKGPAGVMMLPTVDKHCVVLYKTGTVLQPLAKWATSALQVVGMTKSRTVSDRLQCYIPAYIEFMYKETGYTNFLFADFPSCGQPKGNKFCELPVNYPEPFRCAVSSAILDMQLNEQPLDRVAAALKIAFVNLAGRHRKRLGAVCKKASSTKSSQ